MLTMALQQQILRIIGIPFAFVGKYLAQLTLQLMGWKTDARTLAYICGKPRCVAISLHTSNWDSIIAILIQLAYGMPSVYIIKESWLKTPVFGTILSNLGFIGVHEEKHGQVVSIVSALQKKSSFIFVIMPEGQRSYINEWKTGFYYIAKELQINIMPIILDYSEHRIVISDVVVVGNRSLGDVTQECQQKLTLASVPLYPEHAYPAPRCYTHYRASSNEMAKTSVFDWHSMSLLYLIPGLFAYGFLLPVIGLWLIYCQYGAPGVHK